MGNNSLVPVKKLVLDPNIKAKFQEVMHDKAPAFLASVSSAVSTNPSLQKCDPMSVMGSAMIAATLDLPINQSLGFAYIVPYKGQAQFQMGYKGYIQLAIRTGQYQTINVREVYKDELERYNPITDEITFTDFATWKMRDEGKESNIIGYYAYFKLLDGFEKMIFKTTAQIEKHAQKYSANYKKYGTGLWKDNFNAMALKTVLKELISKWGIMSTQVETATKYDYGTTNLNANDDVNYLDNPDETVETTAVEAEEMAGEIFDDTAEE